MSDTLATETTARSTPAGGLFHPAYRFIEFFSVASHVGKSMLAMFVAQLLTELGVKVRIVRIESKAARSRDKNIVHIDTEDFAAAARLPGAEVAVLRPLFELIEEAAKSDAQPVILVDWGGGLATHRAKIYAATRFDARLGELNMRGLSMVVTTSLTDRMSQAAELIGQTRMIAPELDVALLLNRRAGSFNFVEGTEERRVYKDLIKAARNLPIVKIPAVAGESWQACEAAGLSMTEVINLSLDELMQRFGGESRYLVSAYQMHVATYWKVAESDMLRLLGGADATASR
jgi:hypothetical protein